MPTDARPALQPGRCAGRRVDHVQQDGARAAASARVHPFLRSETGFPVELDRGTEPIGRLVDKLASHGKLRAEGGPQYPILFVLPSRLREQHLHRKLTDRPEPTLIIATTSPNPGPTRPARRGGWPATAVTGSPWPTSS